MKKVHIPDFSPNQIAPLIGRIEFRNFGGERGFDINDHLISAERKWAYRVLQTELPPSKLEEFKERGFEIFSCYPTLKQYSAIEEPYNFYPVPVSISNGDKIIYSCLLRSCRVPGVSNVSFDLTRLELAIYDLSELKNPNIPFVEYVPHNITDTDQSLALITLIFNWMNNIQH